MSRADDRATPPRANHIGVWLLVTSGVALAGALAGCDASNDATGATRLDVPATAAIGELPDPLPSDPPPTPPTISPPSTTPETTEPPSPIVGPIGELVLGDRLIVIGDEVLAATAPRNDGLMCDALADFGWDVEVDAEPGRFVEFGHEVLDARLRTDEDLDWDVAAVMLGNHFDGDIAGFTRELDELLDRLAPRPTILYTVTEVDADRVALNRAIRDRPRFHPNVVVIDWAGLSAAEPDVLLVDGGPEVTEEGSGRLVLVTAGKLGPAPGGGGDDPGECLPSDFTDDSAIVL